MPDAINSLLLDSAVYFEQVKITDQHPQAGEAQLDGPVRDLQIPKLTPHVSIVEAELGLGPGIDPPHGDWQQCTSPSGGAVFCGYCVGGSIRFPG